MHNAKMLLQVFVPMVLAAAATAPASLKADHSMKAVIQLPFGELPHGNQVQLELGTGGQTASARTPWGRRRAGRFPMGCLFIVALSALTVTFLVFQCFNMLQSSSSKPPGGRSLAAGSNSCSVLLITSLTVRCQIRRVTIIG